MPLSSQESRLFTSTVTNFLSFRSPLHNSVPQIQHIVCRLLCWRTLGCFYILKRVFVLGKQTHTSILIWKIVWRMVTERLRHACPVQPVVEDWFDLRVVLLSEISTSTNLSLAGCLWKVVAGGLALTLEQRRFSQRAQKQMTIAD